MIFSVQEFDFPATNLITNWLKSERLLTISAKHSASYIKHRHADEQEQLHGGPFESKQICRGTSAVFVRLLLQTYKIEMLDLENEGQSDGAQYSPFDGKYANLRQTFRNSALVLIISEIL